MKTIRMIVEECVKEANEKIQQTELPLTNMRMWAEMVSEKILDECKKIGFLGEVKPSYDSFCACLYLHNDKRLQIRIRPVCSFRTKNAVYYGVQGGLNAFKLGNGACRDWICCEIQFHIMDEEGTYSRYSKTYMHDEKIDLDKMFSHLMEAIKEDMVEEIQWRTEYLANMTSAYSKIVQEN